MAVVIDKDLIKNLKADTDSQLKDLFERSNTAELEKMLKTEVDEDGELVNYIPETFASKTKTNAVASKGKFQDIIKKKKKDKKNEKELDIETSKAREIEIADRNKAKDLRNGFDVEKELELDQKDDKNDDFSRDDLEREQATELERMEEERLREEEEEKAREEDEERGRLEEKKNRRSSRLNEYGALIDDEKVDSQNEDELDIETEKEVRRQHEIKQREKNETKTHLEDLIEQRESKEEKNRDIVREIIEDRETQQEAGSNDRDTGSNIVDRSDNWDISSSSRSYGYGDGYGESGSVLFPWEFNGILIIQDGDTTRTETFYLNGKEETYEEAEFNVLQAKEDFIKRCEQIANSGDFHLLIRNPAIQESLLLYEEGGYKSDKNLEKPAEKIKDEVEKTKDRAEKTSENSKQKPSFVESVNNSKNNSSQQKDSGKSGGMGCRSNTSSGNSSNSGK